MGRGAGDSAKPGGRGRGDCDGVFRLTDAGPRAPQRRDGGVCHPAPGICCAGPDDQEGGDVAVGAGLLANRFGAGWLGGNGRVGGDHGAVPFVQEAVETTGLSPAQWVMLVAGAMLGRGWSQVVKGVRQQD